MKNYTSTEILDIKKSIKMEIEDEYTKHVIAWNNRNKDFNYKHYFIMYHELQSTDILELSVDECIDVLNVFKSECDEFESKNFYSSKFDSMKAIAYDDYVESVFYIRQYGILKTDNIEVLLEKLTNTKFRDHIKSLMFDKKLHRYRRNIDCKLFQLFMENKIDWKSLTNLIYVDCMI